MPQPHEGFSSLHSSFPEGTYIERWFNIFVAPLSEGTFNRMVNFTEAEES
jgi:hypothetical protein